MPRSEFTLSEYRGMWIFTMFDLPTQTKKERKAYAKFRLNLLDLGFSMLQYSVYARYCVSEDVAARHRRTIKKAIPPDGSVRILTVTDRQFGKMENYIGKKVAPTEKPPEQLMLF